MCIISQRKRNCSKTFQPTNPIFFCLYKYNSLKKVVALRTLNTWVHTTRKIREGIILRNIFCVSAASQFRERRRRGGGEKRENKNNNPSQERVLGLRRLRPPPPPRVECALSKQEGGKVCELPAHAAKWEIARWGKRKGEGRIFMGNQIPGAGKGGRGHSTIN